MAGPAFEVYLELPHDVVEAGHLAEPPTAMDAVGAGAELFQRVHVAGFGLAVVEQCLDLVVSHVEKW